MPSPRPHWSVVEVAGHPCEVHAPPDALPGRAIIYLHGVRERWLQEQPALSGLVDHLTAMYAGIPPEPVRRPAFVHWLLEARR